MHDIEVSGNNELRHGYCDGDVYPTQKAAVEAGVRFGRRVIDDLLE